MLPLVVLPFLHMLNLDVHCETLGYEVQLVAKSFHQHPAVALDLFDPFIHVIESPVVPVQSLFNPAKPLVKVSSEPVESLVKVLNKLLIHTASAA
jgi:hypothetical protein